MVEKLKIHGGWGGSVFSENSVTSFMLKFLVKRF